MNRLLGASLAAASLAAATAAAAQTPPPAPPPAAQPPPAYAPPAPVVDPTIHRHLGLYLHLELGLGTMQSKADVGDLKLSGGAGNFGFAIGGAVTENLILAFHIWDSVASSPTYTAGGTSGSTSSDTQLALVGYGLNITYYLMPTNLYFSLTPSITGVGLKDSSGNNYSTDAGLGLRFSVGIEWWVSDHWGLGLDGFGVVASNKDKGSNPATWKSAALGIAFSATYN